jgi:membrane protease YdiL (CAAX protease family)
MKHLRIHHRLMIYLTASLIVACVISPWMSLGADWFVSQWPAWLPDGVPFPKVFNRAFLVSAIVLFFLYRRLLFPPELKRLFTPGFDVAKRNFFIGAGLAVVSIVILVAVMSAAGAFIPYFRLSLGTMLARMASALATSIIVGFGEEFFFRGVLFLGLLQQGGPLRAYLVTNLFYSALHFIKPSEEYFLEGLDVFAGFRHLPTTFDRFFDPLELLPGIIGLFLIGVVFSYALARTGNLYLSIGLHAGWIFGLKTFRLFGNYTRDDLGWAFGSGDPKVVSGVVTWIGILLVGLAVSRITQSTLLAADRPPAKAA